MFFEHMGGIGGLFGLLQKFGDLDLRFSVFVPKKFLCEKSPVLGYLSLARNFVFDGGVLFCVFAFSDQNLGARNFEKNDWVDSEGSRCQNFPI